MNKLAIIGLLVCCAVAVASIKTTETQGPHVLHGPDGLTQTYKTHADCVNAMALGKGMCSDVTNIVKIGVCEDEVKPSIPYAVNADGYTVLPDLIVSDDWKTMQDTGLVNTGPYPNCWVPGLVPHVELSTSDFESIPVQP